MTLPTSGPLTFADIQTEFGGTNPIALGEYYAGGGLVPAGTSGTYGAVPSSGALSIQNFYGTSNYIPVYVEELFQTWLYTGNGSTQTINNGIDLSTKGGLVWIKNRTAYSHALFDTSRGVENLIKSNTTEAQSNLSGSLTSFTTSGFSLGSAGIVNDGSGSYPNNVSWTFREQPKFFDVVTWTGNNSSPRAIAHNLGSTPGCMIVKNTSTGSAWYVYHRSSAASGFTPQECILNLNNTNAVTDNTTFWASTAPTSTVFTVGSSLNSSGETYVAYLFAHNAGGFGLSGTENVISCGSFTTDPSTGGATVNLGYEPQFLLVKSATSAQGWHLIDNMRGMANRGTYGDAAFLEPNTSSAEDFGANCYPTANGFWYARSGNTTYIYIAIRRGPMKVPTVGTSVYMPDAGTNGTNGGIVPIGFPVDLSMTAYRSLGGVAATNDRVRGYGISTAGGSTPLMYTSDTTPETDYSGSGPYFYNAWNTTITRGPNGANPGGAGIITWFMGRAPSFMDVVCYTGAGNGTAVSHNLGVEPELFIVKKRSGAADWVARAPGTGADRYLLPNKTNAQANASGWYSATASQITFATAYGTTAGSGDTYVAYLFATCPGVSKVGSYTGTATTLQVNCGFTGGARFVLIKKTSGTGSWYVWDSARGIVSGNDPYLLLNSTAAEVTNTDYIDTYSAGFEISSTAPSEINENGGSFIFLAIA